MNLTLPAYPTSLTSNRHLQGTMFKTKLVISSINFASFFFLTHHINLWQKEETVLSNYVLIASSYIPSYYHCGLA